MIEYIGGVQVVMEDAPGMQMSCKTSKIRCQIAVKFFRFCQAFGYTGGAVEARDKISVCE